MKKNYKFAINQRLWECTNIKVKIVSPREDVYQDALRTAMNAIRREYDSLNKGAKPCQK